MLSLIAQVSTSALVKACAFRATPVDVTRDSKEQTVVTFQIVCLLETVVETEYACRGKMTEMFLAGVTLGLAVQTAAFPPVVQQIIVLVTVSVSRQTFANVMWGTLGQTVQILHAKALITVQVMASAPAMTHVLVTLCGMVQLVVTQIVPVLITVQKKVTAFYRTLASVTLDMTVQRVI